MLSSTNLLKRSLPANDQLKQLLNGFDKYWNRPLQEIITRAIAGEQQSISQLRLRMFYLTHQEKQIAQSLLQKLTAECKEETFTEKDNERLNHLNKTQMHLTYRQIKELINLKNKQINTGNTAFKKMVLFVLKMHLEQFIPDDDYLNDASLEYNSMALYYKGQYQEAADLGDLDAQDRLIPHESSSGDIFTEEKKDLIARGSIRFLEELAKHYKTYNFNNEALMCYEKLIQHNYPYAWRSLQRIYLNTGASLLKIMEIYRKTFPESIGDLDLNLDYREVKNQFDAFFLAYTLSHKANRHSISDLKNQFNELCNKNIPTIVNALQTENYIPEYYDKAAASEFYQNLLQCIPEDVRNKVLLDIKRELIILRHDFEKTSLPNELTEEILSYLVSKFVSIDDQHTKHILKKNHLLLKNQSYVFSKNFSLFKNVENEFLEENRHRDQVIGKEYDKRFGLVCVP